MSKEIIVFQCEYCGCIFYTKEACENHEDVCEYKIKENNSGFYVNFKNANEVSPKGTR